MKLDENDLRFLRTLKRLTHNHDLDVSLKPGRPAYLVLRRNYGDKIEQNFHMTRQGVRWRFQRIMDMYISAFETILTIERTFGSDLRDMAVRVSKERYEVRQELAQQFCSADEVAGQTGEQVDD